MSITFDRGFAIFKDIPVLTTAGLLMNFETAPSSGTIWTSTVSSSFYSASLVTTGGGTFTYTGSYGGGIVAGGTAGSTTAICTPYNLTSSFTIEMVVQPNATSYWSTYWGNEEYDNNKGWYSYYNSNTLLYAGSRGGVNSYSSPAATSNVPVHLVFTVGSGTLNMYKNGVLQTPFVTAYGAPPSGVSTTGLNFGSRHPNAGTANTPNDSLKGVYYQMRVYDRPLTATEVSQNFAVIKTKYNLG